MATQKGGKFEREVCKALSRWWTHGDRDDVFWRSASSGARATIRRKQNKVTFGQYGDIQATDPIGQPLMDICTIECKTGYASHNLFDLVDKQDMHKPKYESFVLQAITDRLAAKVPYWIIISRRRGRQRMIYVPVAFAQGLARIQHTKRVNFRWPFAKCHCVMIHCSLPKMKLLYGILGMPLEDFLKTVKPEHIILLGKEIDA